MWFGKRSSLTYWSVKCTNYMLMHLAMQISFGVNVPFCFFSIGTSFLDEIPTLGNTKENLTAAVKTENVRQYLTNCTYLQDELIMLYGLKIYGNNKIVIIVIFCPL